MPPFNRPEIEPQYIISDPTLLPANGAHYDAFPGESKEPFVPRAAPIEADLVEAIETCLKQDDVVGGYVDGHIGRVGTFENLPRYIEIGHTREDLGNEPSSGLHLVTVHVWSKSETSKEIHDVLHAAERAIATMDDRMAPKREFTEVRYDERYATYHGLLRVRL